MAEAAIVSALLPVLFEKLASGMLQQLGEMLGVPRELKKLQSTLTPIQSVLQDAEEKEVKDAELRNWLEKLKNAAYDADDVLDEAHYELLWRDADIHRGIKNKVNDFFSSHNPLLFRAQMARKVKAIVSKLDEIAAERSKFHLRSDAAAVERPLEWRQTHSYVIESEVIGREEDKRKIVEMLVSDASSSSGGRGSPKVLPIIGMGGLGKTTIAQMVFNQLKVMAQFGTCMWVCVSEDFSIPRLAKDIIASACGSASGGDASMDQLLHKLRETLGSKRYLLVLDDVWNEDPHRWEELRVLLTFGAEGSVIIVTTRSEVVGAVVGTVDPYRLAHLSEDECWQLFEKRAFPEGAGKRPELAEIGKKIAKRCKGLPLAAKVIGSMMHLRTEEREWQNVLDNEVWNLQDGKDWILRVLKLSYHQLPVHLKRCFAFCAIFPKDLEIEKDLLIQLWMANGFIPTGGTLELEEKGEDIFKELVSRSFFQDIRQYFNQTTTTCKIHDLIHDVALSIMCRECIILDTKQSKGKSDGDIRYLSITEETTPSIFCNNIYNSRSTLRTLLNFSYRSDHFNTNIISKLKVPRVLDLDDFSFQKWPISGDNMKHIRYLDLSFLAFEMLPEAISQLFHLHTLKIIGCGKLRELPKGMRHMCNLRHVYNGGCSSLTHMPIGLHKLSNLQTLTMFIASRKAGSSSIADLKHLNLGGQLRLCKLENVMHGAEAAEANLVSKEKIKTLKLEWSEPAEMSAPSADDAEQIMEALQLHQHIENLDITGYKGRRCPSWMVRCHLLKKLEIRTCCLLGELPCLPSLTELTVVKCPLLCPVKGFFRSMTCLEELKINGSDKLALLLEMEDDDEDSSSSSNNRLGGCLRVLKIRNCIAPLFSSSSSSLGMWKNLNSLEVLNFSDCSSLTCFPDELTRALSSLKQLQIRDCNISFTGTGGGGRREEEEEEEEGGLYFGLQYLTALKYLTIPLASVSLEGLQGLEMLNISGCTKLKSLPDGLRRLTNLRGLFIRDFPAMTTLPDWLGDLTSLRSLDIWNLTSLTTLPDGLGGLTQLKFLDINGCTALATLFDGLGGLTGLRRMSIMGCTALTALPDGMGGLTELVYLMIQECTALTTLPGGLEGLARLDELDITRCPLLATLPMGLQQRLPHLKRLTIGECPRLERQLRTGGDYFHLISGIPLVRIADRRIV